MRIVYVKVIYIQDICKYSISLELWKVYGTYQYEYSLWHKKVQCLQNISIKMVFVDSMGILQ